MRLRILAALLGLALGGALLLAACGGGGDKESRPLNEKSPAATEEQGGDGSAGEVDACSLLTKEEAGQVLGVEAEPSGAEALGPFDSCTYTPTELSAGFKIIVLQVQKDVDKDVFSKAVETGASALGEEAEEVSGVGDEAFYLVGVLMVRQGDYLMQVSVTDTDLDQSDLRDKSKEVAQKALARLP